MNQLAQSESLYLQQHSKNPVHWMPWGDAPFLKAEQEHKPVLVSIGYSSCHWCHVMERESFEDEQTAQFMNEHFVCIKVDREEHPEVDALYMDALVAMTGQGGWPLNMFVTPQRKPFYGGTYFPPERLYQRWSWMEILQSVLHLWNHQQEEVQTQAQQLIAHLQQLKPGSSSARRPDLEPQRVLATLLHQADTENGGWGSAPKFPNPLGLELLLALAPEHSEAAQQLHLSLENLMYNGIYDQVAGGWFRYATDQEWKVPHFEKMLYDNALLISLFARYLRKYPSKIMEENLRQSLDFFRENWMSEQGLFFSAADADSEGKEGKFYVWNFEEIAGLTEPHEEALMSYYQIQKSGNWEGENILHAGMGPQEFCAMNQLDFDDFERMRKHWLAKLFQVREQRVSPDIDKKCQLSWNALMNVALVEAAVLWQDKDLLISAERHLESMFRHFLSGTELLHVRYTHKQIVANADDWAFLIAATLRLASATGNASYTQQAEQLLDQYEDLFWDEASKLYYFSSKKNQSIPVRKLDLHDNPVPSVNAVMASNLRILGLGCERHDLLEKSEEMLAVIAGTALEFPLGYSQSILQILAPIRGVVKLAGLEAIQALPLLNFKAGQKYIFQLEKADTDSAESLMLQTCTAFHCDAPINSLSSWLEKYC